MVESKKQIILSLADLVDSIKTARWKFLCAALIVGFLFFTVGIKRGSCYTARGTIKPQGSKPNLTATMLLFSNLGEAYSSSEGPLYFLNSYPVAAKVSDRLCFQGNLVEIKEQKRVTSPFLVLKAKQHFGRHSPSTPFGGIPHCPETLIFPDPEVSLQLDYLAYFSECSTLLSLEFLDDTTFLVKKGDELIGQGRVGLPFTSDLVAFTLKKVDTPLGGKKYSLSLIPKHLAVHALQKAVSVRVDKENSDLISIVAKHSDRHLAARIVNLFIEEYHNHLKDQGKEKMERQIHYLEEREEATIEKIKRLTEEHGICTKNALEADQFSLLGSPDTAAKVLNASCQRYADLGLRVQALYYSLYKQTKDLPSILTFAKELEKQRPELKQNCDTFTFGIEERALCAQEERLGTLNLQLELINSLSSLLKRDDFHLYILSEEMRKLLLDTEITKLSRFAIGNNHTTKERAFAAEEIAAEKRVILERMAQLRTIYQEEASALLGTIRLSQEKLLCSFAQQLKILEEDIAHFLIQYGEKVDQALFDYQINLSREILGKFHGQILALVEEKNLRFNLESLSSRPFEWAVAPLLPTPPRLHLFAGLGACFGIFLLFAFIVLREAYLGPSASKSNMHAAGFPLLEESELFYTLLKENLATLCIASKKGSSLPSTLAKKLAFSEKKVLLFYFNQQGPSCLESPRMQKEESFSSLQLGEIADPALLKGQAFQELLENLKKEFDAIFFVNIHSPSALLTKIACDLAEKVLYALTDERLSDLADLPRDTLFYQESSQLLEKKKLSEIKIPSSFSLQASPHSS